LPKGAGSWISPCFGAIEIQAAVADPEDFPARGLQASWINLPHVDAARGRGYHRFSRAVRVALKKQGVGRRGVRLTPLALHHQGLSLWRFRNSRGSTPRWMRAARNLVFKKYFKHRLRRGYAEWIGGAGDPECRPARYLWESRRVPGGDVREGAGGQAEETPRCKGGTFTILEPGPESAARRSTPIINAPGSRHPGCVEIQPENPSMTKGAFPAAPDVCRCPYPMTIA